MLVGSDGSNEREISDLRTADGCRLSPDGASALTSSHGALTIVSLTSGESHPIPLDNAANALATRAAWAPDGPRIVFSLARPSHASDIYTARADGSDLVQITSTPDVDDEFSDWTSAH